MGQDIRQSALSRIRVSASRRRAILRTKAEIAAAVCNRELSVEEACNCYTLTLEDLLAYRDASGADVAKPVRKFAHLDRQRAAQDPNAQYRDRRSEAYSRSAMSPGEALKILSLQEGASDNQIRSAHRRLIMENHPDRGGSNYFAAKINGAKDVLLGLWKRLA